MGARVEDVMAELEALGTAQNRKVYPRHGVVGPLFGVSFKNLGVLTKRHRGDHALAQALWATGNHDARVLACMIAAPERMGRGELDRWARAIDNYIVSDAFAPLVARSAHAQSRAEKWVDSKREFVAGSGWKVVARLALDDEALPHAWFEALLPRIEGTLHDAPNRTRHAMNGAVIAIGCRSAGLRRRAKATAKRVGAVHVDHGQTSCKTPDARAAIDKTWAYRERKAASKSKKAKKAKKRARA